ncbi:hypothetical protein Tco_1023323 [Tanacetum coccineum]
MRYLQKLINGKYPTNKEITIHKKPPTVSSSELMDYGPPVPITKNDWEPPLATFSISKNDEPPIYSSITYCSICYAITLWLHESVVTSITIPVTFPWLSAISTIDTKFFIFTIGTIRNHGSRATTSAFSWHGFSISRVFQYSKSQMEELRTRKMQSCFSGGIRTGIGISQMDTNGSVTSQNEGEIVKSLEVSFDLSPRQKAVVECLRAPRAQNFLTIIPIEGLGQHISALEYRTILKYRLMIPLHDLVRDVLYDVLKRAGISSKKEAPMNFLTGPLKGRSTLRPADILVFGWAGGKHACVDLTGVSPLVGLRDNEFVAGQAALKAESSKVAKHEKACLENQHVFIPFAFDTFGFPAPEADEFLTRVQRVVQSNFSTPKTQNFIFRRIGFAIQKGVAAQLVARLLAILL